MTTETRRKDIPEQTAQHVYHNPVPVRSGARAAATEEPPSRQRRLQDASNHSGNTPQRNLPRTQPPPHDEEDDALYPQRPPSSARRYQPSTQQADTHTVRKGNGHARAFYTLIVGSSIIAGITIALIVPPLWQRGVNQVVYSYPRISQTDANVGHGSAKYPDDHFIALNNHGYVEVLEIPEGVPDKDHPPQIYLVARPDGADADQAPATLTFEDVNGDGKVDILVHCNGNESILYNDGHTFKPTP